jgi:hypothetical protein
MAALRWHWWGWMFHGLAALALAAGTLTTAQDVSPARWFVGYLLVVGVVLMVEGLWGRSEGELWTWLLLWGVSSCAFGIGVAVYLYMPLPNLTLVAASWAIVSGGVLFAIWRLTIGWNASQLWLLYSAGATWLFAAACVALRLLNWPGLNVATGVYGLVVGSCMLVAAIKLHAGDSRRLDSAVA